MKERPPQRADAKHGVRRRNWFARVGAGAIAAALGCANYQNASDAGAVSGEGGTDGSSGGSSSSSSSSTSGGGSSGDANADSRSDSEAGVCAVTFPDLVAYYPFDGDANDHSGNNSDAVAMNVTYVPGLLGQACLFNGSTSSVVVSLGSTGASQARTFCAWISPSAAGTTGLGLPVILSGTKLTTPPLSDQFSVAASTPQEPPGCATATANALFLDHYGSPCATSSSTAVTTGRWNFVCYETTSGSQLQFYVNGASSPTIAGTTYDWEVPLIAIGTNAEGSSTTERAFNGAMDDVSLWSVVLTSSQLATLYASGHGCKAHE